MIAVMTEQRYLMAFTAGGLLYRASLTVARRFEAARDWEAVRAEVLDGNLLRMRTANAARRIYREVASRLQALTPAEMDLLLAGSRQEQQHVLWLATCKRYRFIHDFAVEVIREKFLRLDFQLSYDDYDVFFNNKAEWHPELENLAASTRKKLREVVFKMMREADLLTKDDQILPAMLTPRTVEVTASDSPAHLAIFPVSAAEIQAWLR
jgi:hypothetical protein